MTESQQDKEQMPQNFPNQLMSTAFTDCSEQMIAILFRLRLNCRLPMHFSSSNSFFHFFAHTALRSLLPTMISKIIDSQPPQVGPSGAPCPPKMSLPVSHPCLLHRCMTACQFKLELKSEMLAANTKEIQDPSLLQFSLLGLSLMQVINALMQ